MALYGRVELQCVYSVGALLSTAAVKGRPGGCRLSMW